MRSSFLFFKIWTTALAIAVGVLLYLRDVPEWIVLIAGLLIVSFAAGFIDHFSKKSDAIRKNRADTCGRDV